MRYEREDKLAEGEDPVAAPEPVTERRSRQSKGIVVFIDADSRSCDRVARTLEARGYHVLTAENPSEGAELVRARRPDAVVASEGPTEDNDRVLSDIVASHLPPQAPLILRCGGSFQGRHVDGDEDHSLIVRVHQSIGAHQLGWLLDRLSGNRRR